MMAQSRTQSRPWSELLALVVLVGFGSLPFLQVSEFGFLNYDDPLHVGEQAQVLDGLGARGVLWSLTATPSNLWHPLTWLSYMAEVSCFGGGGAAPGVHHLGNLALHLGATVFFYILLRNLDSSAVVAAVVAVLFSVHPLHVEPVAWISSRKDVLYGFFALGALVSYRKWQQAEGGWGYVRVGWFWVALGALVAAVASKPTAVILPGLFLLLDEIPTGKGQGQGKATPGRAGGLFLRRVGEKWPFFLVSALGVATAVSIQYSGSHAGFMAGHGLVERLALLPASVAFYLQHTFWPAGLCFDYASPTGLRRMLLTGSGLLVLVAGAGSLFFLGSRRWSPVAVGLLWYLVCLAPVLGIFYVGSGFTADRYAYLALGGPAVALAAWLEALRGRRRLVAVVLVGLAALFAGVLSFRQAGVWKDDAALFSHGVRIEPGSGVAQTNLASLYRLQKKEDLALDHYQRALKLDSSRYIIHYNMAAIYRGRGMVSEAIEACRLSLKSHPKYARSHHLLGKLLEEPVSSEEKAALFHLEEASRIEPESSRFAITLAQAYARRGSYNSAERVLRDVLQIGTPSQAERKRIDRFLRKLAPYLGGD